MNRRDMIKGTGMTLAAAVGVSAAQTKISHMAGATAGGNPMVLFHGLWAFWHHQPSPDGRKEGILAFTPGDPQLSHSYLAWLNGNGSPRQLETGQIYAVSSGTNPISSSPYSRIKTAHNAGLFLDATDAQLDQDQMDSQAARRIWLPYPDDIWPVAKIDLGKNSLFRDQANLRQQGGPLQAYWPMVQAFVYGGSSKLALELSGNNLVEGMNNLHFSTIPPMTMNDGGKHARAAQKALLSLISIKSTAKFKDFTFASGLVRDMAVCADFPPNSNLDPVTDGLPVTSCGQNTAIPTGTVSIYTDPSNCAAGGGTQGGGG